jgi:hypothetical protein
MSTTESRCYGGFPLLIVQHNMMGIRTAVPRQIDICFVNTQHRFILHFNTLTTQNSKDELHFKRTKAWYKRAKTAATSQVNGRVHKMSLQ